MKLSMLFEADLRRRELERAAANGDHQAMETLKWYLDVTDGDHIDNDYAKRVRTFCVRNLPIGTSRHVVRNIISTQLDLRERDLHFFDMEDSLGGMAGVCFVDRYNKMPSDGMDLFVSPDLASVRNSMYPTGLPQEEVEGITRAWADVRAEPVDGWFLEVYHFASVDDSRMHHGRLYSGTQSRIAYKKLDAGTIKLSDKNPPDWPANSRGVPFKSNRKALGWVADKLPGINLIGSLQGPENKVNRQFLFVRS